jgi:hypothetical protein
MYWGEQKRRVRSGHERAGRADQIQVVELHASVGDFMV